MPAAKSGPSLDHGEYRTTYSITTPRTVRVRFRSSNFRTPEYVRPFYPNFDAYISVWNVRVVFRPGGGEIHGTGRAIRSSRLCSDGVSSTTPAGQRSSRKTALETGRICGDTIYETRRPSLVLSLFFFRPRSAFMRKRRTIVRNAYNKYA